MNIYLVGFMGSGKSSLGQKLAEKLNRSFVDLDQRIEEHSGKSISEIFQQEGEEQFRKIETELLFQTARENDKVIALGGGTPCHETNWSFLEQNGLIIYLRTKNDVLFGRLRNDKAHRPLIANLDDESLIKFIDEKLVERSPFYEKAHFIYEKDKSSLSFLVNQISAYLR